MLLVSGPLVLPILNFASAWDGNSKQIQYKLKDQNSIVAKTLWGFSVYWLHYMSYPYWANQHVYDWIHNLFREQGAGDSKFSWQRLLEKGYPLRILIGFEDCLWSKKIVQKTGSFLKKKWKFSRKIGNYLTKDEDFPRAF